MIYLDILLTILMVLAALLLYLLAGYAAKAKNPLWRLLYFLPLIVCVLLTGYVGLELCMLGVYLGALVLMAGFVFDKEKIRKAACVLAAVLSLSAFPLCSSMPSYRTVDFVKDFEDGFAYMKAHYILAEHKGIDWDELYAEYLPLFEEANRDRDEVRNAAVWLRFTAEFNDGHTGFSPSTIREDRELYDKINDYINGNDYGLSLMGLADGSFVAVCVEPDSALTAAGIHNGTVITGWDGMGILEAAQLSEANAAFNHADKDNELFAQAIYAAGVGGDSVTLTYIADDGSEQSIILPKLGSYTERMESTMDTVNRGVEVGNLEWAQVSEDACCLRIKAMMSTAIEETEGDFAPMQVGITEKLAEFESLGCDKLIIDMRSNSGGSGNMVKALAELFAPVGEHYYATDGLWDSENNCYATDPSTGRYLAGTRNTYTGRDVWGGKPIVILVNSLSVSAADHLTAILSGFGNVTVMGLTESNGSAQGVGSVALETGMLAFSACLLLDENGDIFIDSGADLESSNDIDIRIPFDTQAVAALFDRDEDYVLDYALDYLENLLPSQ